jgi:hypothetical protein
MPLPLTSEPVLPFTLNRNRRHHIPKQKRKVISWSVTQARANAEA